MTHIATAGRDGRIVLVLLSLILTLSAPASLSGSEVTDTPVATLASEGPEVRVVNNHGYRIQLVLVDAEGTHRTLGSVASRQAKVFTLDPALAGNGPVRVKVVLDEPAWSPANADVAVRSGDLQLDADSAVYVWIETDLESTSIEIVQ